MCTKVHFRSGIGGDSKITTTAYEIIADLDKLDTMVKGKADQLEKSLTQLVEYQTQIQELRKKIIQEEQQLRHVMAPTYLPHDREKATTEQQVRFSSIQLLSFFFFITMHIISFDFYHPEDLKSLFRRNRNIL